MHDLLLKNLNRHIKLNDEEFSLFTTQLIIERYKKNSYLLRLGNICYYTHFVSEGLVRLYETTKTGENKNIMFAKEEWWVSDLYSFHKQKPSNYSLQCLEDTVVFKLSKSKMEELFMKIPKLERFWRILHINAFIAQQERSMHLISKTAEERYIEFIEKYPDAELRISQKHIASYLGITPEFLSKMKSKLKS